MNGNDAINGKDAIKKITFCGARQRFVIAWKRSHLGRSPSYLGPVSRLLIVSIYTVTAALIIAIFPATRAVFSYQADPAELPVGEILSMEPAAGSADLTVLAIEDMLSRHSRVSAAERERIAQAVVASGRKYDVDPHLVASILLVESSGNPYAISNRDAVGIMQIHLPTWASVVEMEKINLFRVEDNVDLGARILKEYLDRHGLWNGVRRYLGGGASEDEALRYLSRIQGIYADRQAGD